MGVLRFLLALSVAWTHAGLPKGLSGDLCVTIFFVISGFYMAMVLNENPAYGQVSAFYQQRLLRLFPTYWALLALALLAGVITPSAVCAAAVGSLAANDFGHMNAGLFSKAAAVTLVLTVAIPWLFMLTRNNRLDRHLGEYSYPLYLCHVLVFELLGLLQWSSAWSAYLMIATATALAAVLTVAVDKPADRFRHRLFRAR